MKKPRNHVKKYGRAALPKVAILLVGIVMLIVIGLHPNSINPLQQLGASIYSLFKTTTSGPIGFASLNGGTTGGNPKNTCNVAIIESDPETTTKNLLDAIECAKKYSDGAVVTFTPPGATAQITKTINLPSNITLQGPAKLEDASIRIHGKQNIIIRNLVFTTLPTGHTNGVGKPCPDPTAPTTRGTGVNGTTGCPTPILVSGSDVNTPPDKATDSTNIWIDHNVFNRCGDKCIVLTTGTAQDTGRYTGTDAVTVSNNIFKNSFLGMLVTYQGSALRPVVSFNTEKCEKIRDTEPNILPRIRATVYGNLFINVHQRTVRASYCTVEVHEFNNAIIDNAHELSEYPDAQNCEDLAGKGPESVHGAQILFENNFVSSWRNGPPTLKGVVCTNDIVQSGHTDPETGVDKVGYIKLRNNLLTNGATAHEFGANKVRFEIPYTYSLLPARLVYQSVMETAGNTLINSKAAN